jgi:uncharacterized protein YpmB
MTEKKKEIVTLLTEAKNKEVPVKEEKQIGLRYVIIILIIFICITLGAALAYLDLKKKYEDMHASMSMHVSESLKRADELEGEKKFSAARERYASVLGIDSSLDQQIKASISRLDHKIHGNKEVQAYFDKIQIKNLRLRRNQYELKVAGNIVNSGKRYLSEIELTIYCLDEEERPVCEKKIKTVSSDGKPLKKYQKRRFSLAIPDVPEGAKEVQVIVTDIEFVDVYE